MSKIKALSLGVSEHSPWDLEMANLGVKVIEYDASIQNSPYKHENISFHKKFISNKNDDLNITFEKVLKDNELKGDENILQCDIENSEWDMLENLDIRELKRYFSQIIFEFHGCNPEESSGFEKRIKILNKLNSEFTPFHTHLNNHGKIFYSRGLFFSTTIEVSFLRKDIASKYKQVYYKKGGNIKNLDYPSVPYNPELPLYFERLDR
ncbi:hypothetical protein [Campylobacter sp. LR291e]|uniref:hypothetical protein n=1 Tax=Campylobacter sp. LR291e TaxID=2593546 RepID=UPI001CC1C702|nr:hypothetical protein [Campylobacter sp. LR291e]